MTLSTGGLGAHPRVDLDLLADYVAGVLPATEAAHVAALIAGDAQWGAAHARLAAAIPRIQADLASAGRDPVRMPDDIVARIEAGLASAQRRPDAQRRPEPQRPEFVRERPFGEGGVLVSLADRRRRRQVRLASFAAAAAALVAVVGGLAVLTGFPPSRMAGAPTIAGAEDTRGNPVPGPPEFQSGAGTPVFLASGTNYTTDTLGQLANRPEAEFALATGAPASVKAGAAGVPSPIQRDVSADAAMQQLTRLTQPAALTECLHAVTTEHPGTTVVVDFARFNSAPALVILLITPSGRVTVAVGSGCGVSGPDQRGIAFG